MAFDADTPEISDLIVSFDPDSLTRRDVRRDAVLIELRRHGMSRAVDIVSGWPHRRGVLDSEFVDGVLLRSHLEMQRLSEEFQQGERMARLLTPVCKAARSSETRTIKIVDVGCGLGYVTRWLAARAKLGREVELSGCDYNAVLIREAKRLAEVERLPCSFAVANAFGSKRTESTTHIYTSTGVIHHFRGDALARFFGEQARAEPIGFVHCDIKPTWLAPLGSWLFHRVRMREPLARIDGVLSAIRAHSGLTLTAAARKGSPGYVLFLFDAEPERIPILQVMQALLGVRRDLVDGFVASLGDLA
jgi:SAM-dependent methyltransferase